MDIVMYSDQQQIQDQHFVVVTERRDHVQWLNSALGYLGEVVVADEDIVDRVAQLVDATSAALVLVDFDSDRLQRRQCLVEELYQLKPMLGIVAFGDEPNQQLLLALMRMGVRDFIPVGAPAREVEAQISRILLQKPNIDTEASGGELFALLCARPGVDSATLAVHMALKLARLAGSDRPVLLLDLGVPGGDCLHFLDLKPSYTVLDAIRGVRRFDSQLVNTAFARHKDGLAVLSLPQGLVTLTGINAADAAVLLDALSSYFAHVVVNLGGLPVSELHCQVLKRARHKLVLAEQSVYSVESTQRMLESLAEYCKKVPEMTLVVDRYLRRLGPDAVTLGQLTGLRLGATLPASGLARFKAVNAGYSLYQMAPRDPYIKAIEHLLDDLRFSSSSSSVSGWFKRLLRRGVSANNPSSELT